MEPVGFSSCHKKWQMTEYGELQAVQKADDEQTLTTEIKKAFCLRRHHCQCIPCHIEYEYFDKGDFSTLEDTYYIYPKEQPFSVAKIALATEELFAFYCKEQGVTPPQQAPSSCFITFLIGWLQVLHH